MPNPGIENPAARRFWSSSGWLRLWHSVMAGLRHDVTGRASALHSLAMVASRGLSDDGMVVEELNREAANLGALVRVLNDVPSAIGRPGLGVGVSDVLASVPELLDRAADFSGSAVAVSEVDALPAVGVEAGPLRAVVLLTVAHVIGGSSGRRCQVTGTNTDSGIELVIQADDFEPSSADEWMDDEATTAGAALLEGWGGRLSGGAGRWVLTLPTL